MKPAISQFNLKRKAWVVAVALSAMVVAACTGAGGNPAGTDAQPAATATSLPNLSSIDNRPLPEYISPLPDAQYVSTNDTIIVRYGPTLGTGEVSRIQVTVQGMQSGAHSGKLILADDQRTAIYKPDQPYTPGEQVKVQVNTLRLDSGTLYQPFDYTFTVATNQKPGAVASTGTPTSTPQSAFPDYLTLPQDIPHFNVSISSPHTANEGYIFIAPFFWTASTVGSYLLIIDNHGEIVYYQSMADEQSGFDFKVLPKGYLTYFVLKDSTHVILDSRYQVIGTYPAKNGYTADLHDFIMTPDGYMYLMAYDTETIDLSKVAPGGNSNAAVTGLVIQELDPDQKVIFEWRSWDHFKFSDTTADLTKPQVDLVHGNGLALTGDGNLLLSSRNLNEVTKINVKTGDIMWRLGGKNSTFKFVNDNGFAYQHDVGVAPNGNITLFDNHGTDQTPTASRAVEYKLDLTNNTATLVWEFTHTPPVFTDFMGNVQRLPNGNTFIGWGNAGQTGQKYVFSSITEVSPDNQVIFELTFDKPYVSYRAFRSPWVGFPSTTPALAFVQSSAGLKLGYSWNGATQVVSWNLYGGASTQNMQLVDQEKKSGFETQTYLTNLPASVCFFQVAALDQSGKELARSVVISTNTTSCPLGN